MGKDLASETISPSIENTPVNISIGCYPLAREKHDGFSNVISRFGHLWDGH
jgi:hypothetical protein